MTCQNLKKENKCKVDEEMIECPLQPLMRGECKYFIEVSGIGD